MMSSTIKFLLAKKNYTISYNELNKKITFSLKEKVSQDCLLKGEVMIDVEGEVKVILLEHCKVGAIKMKGTTKTSLVRKTLCVLFDSLDIDRTRALKQLLQGKDEGKGVAVAGGGSGVSVMSIGGAGVSVTSGSTVDVGGKDEG